MKTESLLALALLLFVVMGCDPNDNRPSGTSQRPPASQGSNPGQGSGPVSESGPDRVDYGPTRHPGENAHDYNLRQRGQIGPCGRAWDYYYASYFDWKNGRITEGLYRQAEQGYNQCVAQNYP